MPTPSVVTDIAAGRPVDAVWVNDPRADLAVAEWSLRYNYGGDWRDEFFDAYGAAPDQDRMDHYLQLWEGGD